MTVATVVVAATAAAVVVATGVGLFVTSAAVKMEMSIGLTAAGTVSPFAAMMLVAASVNLAGALTAGTGLGPATGAGGPPFTRSSKSVSSFGFSQTDSLVLAL